MAFFDFLKGSTSTTSTSGPITAKEVLSRAVSKVQGFFTGPKPENLLTPEAQKRISDPKTPAAQRIAKQDAAAKAKNSIQLPAQLPSSGIPGFQQLPPPVTPSRMLPTTPLPAGKQGTSAKEVLKSIIDVPNKISQFSARTGASIGLELSGKEKFTPTTPEQKKLYGDQSVNKLSESAKLKDLSSQLGIRIDPQQRYELAFKGAKNEGIADYIAEDIANILKNSDPNASIGTLRGQNRQPIDEIKKKYNLSDQQIAGILKPEEEDKFNKNMNVAGSVGNIGENVVRKIGGKIVKPIEQELISKAVSKVKNLLPGAEAKAVGVAEEVAPGIRTANAEVPSGIASQEIPPVIKAGEEVIPAIEHRATPRQIDWSPKGVIEHVPEGEVKASIESLAKSGMSEAEQRNWIAKSYRDKTGQGNANFYDDMGMNNRPQFSFDMRGFSGINDQYGYESGNLVLKKISELLDHHFGDIPMKVRFQGDEYYVLSEGLSAAEAKTRWTAFENDLANTKFKSVGGFTDSSGKIPAKNPAGTEFSDVKVALGWGTNGETSAANQIANKEAKIAGTRARTEREGLAVDKINWEEYNNLNHGQQKPGSTIPRGIEPTPTEVRREYVAGTPGEVRVPEEVRAVNSATPAATAVTPARAIVEKAKTESDAAVQRAIHNPETKQAEAIVAKEAEEKLKPGAINPDNKKLYDVAKKQINSRWTKIREKFQDSWARVEKLYKVKGVKVAEGADPYHAYIRYSGRVSTRVEKIKEAASNIDKEILRLSKETKVPDKTFKADVNEYLIAQHAPERNAKHGTAAAGITDEEARLVTERINASPHAEAVKKVAKQVKELNDQTLDVLLDAEVINQRTYDTLKKTYKNHVPLQRVMNEEEDIVEVLGGGGLDVKSTGIKRAIGSKREVKDILTNVVVNLEAATIRAEKNLVDLNTLKFARANKELGLFEEIVPREAGISKEGRTIYKPVTDPQVLTLREGGVPTYLKVNDPNLACASS